MRETYRKKVMSLQSKIDAINQLANVFYANYGASIQLSLLTVADEIKTLKIYKIIVTGILSNQAVSIRPQILKLLKTGECSGLTEADNGTVWQAYCQKAMLENMPQEFLKL